MLKDAWRLVGPVTAVRYRDRLRVAVVTDRSATPTTPRLLPATNSLVFSRAPCRLIGAMWGVGHVSWPGRIYFALVIVAGVAIVPVTWLVHPLSVDVLPKLIYLGVAVQ